MNKSGWLILILMLSLPALTCSVFQAEDLDATATQIAVEIYARMTVEAPTVTFTVPPTEIPTQTFTPTSIPTDTPVPTDTHTPVPTNTPEPTKPTVPTFGPLVTYSEETDEDGLLSNPTDEFPAGTTKIYACFDYWAMDSSLRYSLYWRVNGESFTEASRYWDGDEEGNTCWYIWRERSGALQGLPTGNWEVILYLGNELAQKAEFHIGD